MIGHVWVIGEGLCAKRSWTCRVCMRFMPIEGVCYAGLEDISKLGKKVLPEHFPVGDDIPQTTVSSCRSPEVLSHTVHHVPQNQIACVVLQFGVLYEHRATDLLKRMDVINTVVDCIPQVRFVHTKHLCMWPWCILSTAYW